ncbi:hypothetical protein, partial [Enterococcus casseliflavus]|uniref:hypothetical protein n=1 Tax=Enterococcus casseliflavus TaxID=37734 RepID=UPI003D14111F
KIRIVSLGERTVSFEMPLADFEEGGQPLSYEAARTYFRREPEQHWAAYVAGAFLVLSRERGVYFTEGARLLIDSEVPEGKGV